MFEKQEMQLILIFMWLVNTQASQFSQQKFMSKAEIGDENVNYECLTIHLKDLLHGWLGILSFLWEKRILFQMVWNR